jgi:hypothetical protein
VIFFSAAAAAADIWCAVWCLVCAMKKLFPEKMKIKEC